MFKIPCTDGINNDEVIQNIERQNVKLYQTLKLKRIQYLEWQEKNTNCYELKFKDKLKKKEVVVEENFHENYRNGRIK